MASPGISAGSAPASSAPSALSGSGNLGPMARAVTTFTGEVLPEWGDYNDHLNEGYYGVIFGHASDGLLELLGFGPEYRQSFGGTFYTVETQIRFEAEIALGEPITVETTLLGADPKRLHYWHELRVVGAPARSATQEGLMLHVDIEPVKVTAMSPAMVDAASGLTASHASIRGQADIGRAIRAVRAQ